MAKPVLAQNRRNCICGKSGSGLLENAGTASASWETEMKDIQSVKSCTAPQRQTEGFFFAEAASKALVLHFRT